jgi:hypothetical protein
MYTIKRYIALLKVDKVFPTCYPLGYMYNTSRVQCVQMLTLKKGKGGTARLDYRRGSDRIESNQSLLLPVRPPDGSLSCVQAWCTLLVLV